MSTRVVPAKEADARSALPAAFAAAAEGGLYYLLVQEIVLETDRASGGPMASYAVFLVLFAGGVAAGTAFRRFLWMPTALAGLWAAVGLVQGLAFGSASGPAVAGTVLMALALAARAVALSLRDWRDPVGESMLIGGLGALILIALGAGAGGEWAALLPVVVPAFFVGSLASRAASVRLEEIPEEKGMVVGTDDGSGRGPATAIRSMVLALLVLAGVLGGLAATSGKGGLLQQALGGLLGLIGIALGWVLVALSPVLAPILWVAERLHIDLSNILFFEGLRLVHRRSPAGHGASPIGTILAAVVMLGLIALLFWMIRRRRLMFMRYSRRPGSPSELDVSEAPHRGPGLFAGGLLRRRREMPAQTIRRLYAEALVALEDRGIDKPVSLTPAEFAPVITAAFPAAAQAFESLTHSYEDVRYGSIEVSGAVAIRLKTGQAPLLQRIRQDPRADVPDEGGETL